MAAVLGISAFFHDSAAALVIDGEIVAAAQEERFSRIKHDAALPAQAIACCLRVAGLTPADIDTIAFYEKPFVKFERLLETYLAVAPRGLRSFMRAMPSWLQTKLRLRTALSQSLGSDWRGRLLFTTHHEAHAASAFYPSPFEDAAILTIDGVGEWATATIGAGRGNRIELLRELRFPHSLGLLYSAFTDYCGFTVNSGEYKLMGLAPYGTPVFADRIRSHLVDIKPDGSIALDMRYFSYAHGLTMTNRRFADLFGGPRRAPDSDIAQRFMDVAASIQMVTEEIVVRMAATARRLTGLDRLCLAGGVALNCVANGRIIRSRLVDDLFITPASGDAGGAVGAALAAHYQVDRQPRQARAGDSLRGSFLGPAYTNEEIRAVLDEAGASYEVILDEATLLQRVAADLARGLVVGWFQGRMEFGPRALGGRSILADPRAPGMQATLNQRIKFRESFRPFGPAVLREDAQRYFDLAVESPYMLLVADVHPAQELPGVTHRDRSARIQTVDAERHGRFWRLLTEFKRQTGCAVLVNTSFNVRDEPIVCTPADAYRCFRATALDVLVLEDILITSERPA